MTHNVGYAMAGLAPQAAPRNAERKRFYQVKLKKQKLALKAAYGWRKDYIGPNSLATPYLPVPFAKAMLDYFVKQSAYWLSRTDFPAGAHRPGEIRGRRDKAIAIFKDPKNREPAPAHVAKKAPAYYKKTLPAGKPHPDVLTGEATFWFFYRLSQLAIHFDVLPTGDTKWDLFVEAGKETLEELPGRVSSMVTAPLKKGAEWLSMAAAVGVGLAVLYVVTR